MDATENSEDFRRAPTDSVGTASEMASLRQQLEAQNKVLMALASTVEQLRIESNKSSEYHGAHLKQALQAAINSIKTASPAAAEAPSLPALEPAPEATSTTVVAEKRASAVDEAFAEFARMRASK